jgi:hypothetical protein
MKKNTTFTKLIQTLLPEEEINSLTQSVEYEDKARKFTIYQLLQYWIHAALEKWEGFRDGADRADQSGLPPVNYSTFSKKASEVPYEIFQHLFHRLVAKCNRSTRRKLKLLPDLNLLLVDSTTITVGKNRLPWAAYHGERAGVKLHIALDAATDMPVHVVETVATQHDGPIGEQLANPKYILVQDRAYGKIERLDQYLMKDQPFVIRLKGNIQIVEPQSLSESRSESSPIQEDITCRLGSPQFRSQYRHRIISFKDEEGHEFRIVTNLMSLSAEEIAEIYKVRWRVEVFFRWMKQHLNVKRLFGTTPHAVYGQLYTALITYVLLKWFYDQTRPHILQCFSLSFARFTRLLSLNGLPTEWRANMIKIFASDPYTHPPNI